MLDNVCVIISDPENIITQRHVYCLNLDQSAAAYLIKFLLDTLDAHKLISYSARDEMFHIIGNIVSNRTRNEDKESKKFFQKQKQRYLKEFVKGLELVEPISIVHALSTEKLLKLL